MYIFATPAISFNAEREIIAKNDVGQLNKVELAATWPHVFRAVGY